MLCIDQKDTNPYFNIAAEEYLLKNFRDNIFMLYVNEPSLIIGKHQNTLAEIDYQLAKDKGISVVRRLSGGGAVYHDLGNLNFTIIKNGAEGKLVDFKGFTQPIVSLLAKLNVKAEFTGHNSLYVDGKKISGNAEHIFKKRVIHHGTLLFSTNLQMLSNLLYVNTNRYTDKAVKSVRANTTNLKEYLPESYTIIEFKEFIFNYFLQNFENSTSYEFSQDDRKEVNALVRKKYGTWDWNFGYSPTYGFKREIELGGFKLEMSVLIDKGFFKTINFSGDAMADSTIEGISANLIGVRHNENEVENALKVLGLIDSDMDQLLRALF
jgi:lipoate---protein ligase